MPLLMKFLACAGLAAAVCGCGREPKTSAAAWRLSGHARTASRLVQPSQVTGWKRVNAVACRCVATLLLAGCVRGAGEPSERKGAGVIRAIRIPADRDTVWCGRSFDGSFVLFVATASDPQVLCMDTTFKNVRSVDATGGAYSASCTGPTVLHGLPGGLSYELIELPDLKCVDTLSVRGDSDFARVGWINEAAMCSTPGGTWLRVSDSKRQGTHCRDSAVATASWTVRARRHQARARRGARCEEC